ncbi:MFS transporter [Streptomyces pluripotens]|uniref:MFS transporter n=1 Tax=Streptomyces pluripotens TaxID=1355015 RepID=A0A221P4M4_9ACTN|nr:MULTISPECIES: MFS transporter [Streptomyces]ARP72852.1 MFS transporter [Streptomyces pluripotens]ASN27102.1 MFS transporter [Streptomyces pluripotens]KIE23590.1 transporter [Streptomyces sp. MUSC 125]MCH0559845.1 MFS transporter [Streptomyces sp. MUM 16J]
MPMPAPSFQRAKWSIAALFCFLGFQYGTWVSRLPALKTRLDLGAGEVGLLLMACGAGAAASFPLVAVLMRRLGSRRLSLASALCLTAVLAALSVVPDYPLAVMTVCADGVAVGCLNVAMNAQGAALEKEYGRTAMSQLHATFSAGLLTAALLASAVTTATPSLPAHFTVAGSLLLLLLGCARPALLDDPDTGPAHPDTSERRRRLSPPSGRTLLMGCAMVFGTITEGAMNDWSTLYLKDVVRASATVAPLGIAVVSVMMLLARVCADRWRTRWGDGRVVRTGSTVAGAGLALALLVGGVVPTLLGFACVGLGAAAVTPCVYVAAAERGSDSLALVAAMGTTGLLGGPALIGFVASAANLTLGMAAVAASALIVAVTAVWIPWRARVPAVG